jgi:hypothetical protein
VAAGVDVDVCLVLALVVILIVHGVVGVEVVVGVPEHTKIGQHHNQHILRDFAIRKGRQ